MSGIVGKNLGRGSGLIKIGSVGADSVTGASITDDSIDSEHYVDASIDEAHMSANSIDSDSYVDGSIDLAHMSSESVDEDNLHISNAGTNGQFLSKQSGNSGGLTWADAAGGGGKIGQVLQTTSTTATATTGGYTAMVPTGTITCAATSSKVLVQWSATVRLHGNSDSSTDKGFNLQLRRTPSGGSDTDYVFGGNTAYKFVYHALGTFGSTEEWRVQAHFIYLDSPSSTAALTYTPMLQVHQGGVTVCYDSSTAQLILSEVLA